MKKLLVLAVVLTLIGCAPASNNDGEFVKVEFLEYEIVKINRPKHFSVDLRDVRNGNVFERMGSSKHCNGHRNWDVGNKITVKSTFYRKSDGTIVYSPSDNDVNTIICD